MARRLTLVGIFVTITPGSIVQLIIGTVFSAVYLLIQMQVGPYMETSDDFLANGCSFSLVVYFLCCIMFKVGTLTEVHHRASNREVASAACRHYGLLPTLPAPNLDGAAAGCASRHV